MSAYSDDLDFLREENRKLRAENEDLRRLLAIAKQKVVLYRCRKCRKSVPKVTIYKQQCDQCDPYGYFYNEDIIKRN